MKPFYIKQTVFVTVFILSLLFLCSCSPDTINNTPGNEKEISLTVSVDGSAADSIGKDFYESADITLEQGASVYDALKTIAEAKNLTVSVTDKYVQEINGLKEDDIPGGGWLYKINGEIIWEIADSCMPEDGDCIEWIYITE